LTPSKAKTNTTTTATKERARAPPLILLVRTGALFLFWLEIIRPPLSPALMIIHAFLCHAWKGALPVMAVIALCCRSLVAFRRRLASPARPLPPPPPTARARDAETTRRALARSKQQRFVPLFKRDTLTASNIVDLGAPSPLPRPAARGRLHSSAKPKAKKRKKGLLQSRKIPDTPFQP